MKDAKEKKVEQTTETKPVSEEKKPKGSPDIELLDGIVEKYPLTEKEKKFIVKIKSLLENTKTKSILPPQNVGDSVFKMYESDSVPTEFVVDRIEFDQEGWKLISYEKFDAGEVSFVFLKKDYNKYFFDTAEQARAYHKK